MAFETPPPMRKQNVLYCTALWQQKFAQLQGCKNLLSYSTVELQKFGPARTHPLPRLSAPTKQQQNNKKKKEILVHARLQSPRKRYCTGGRPFLRRSLQDVSHRHEIGANIGRHRKMANSLRSCVPRVERQSFRLCMFGTSPFQTPTGCPGRSPLLGVTTFH